jgi:hypothetical protein
MPRKNKQKEPKMLKLKTLETQSKHTFWLKQIEIENRTGS